MDELAGTPDGRTAAPRRLWPWLTGLGVAVVVGAALLWVDRARELATGLPCEARGWMGCAIDGPLYFAVALGLGGALLAITALAGLLLRRRSAAAVPATTAVAGAVWLVLVGMLVSGARS